MRAGPKRAVTASPLDLSGLPAGGAPRSMVGPKRWSHVLGHQRDTGNRPRGRRAYPLQSRRFTA
jgi:hypothetical protein